MSAEGLGDVRDDDNNNNNGLGTVANLCHPRISIAVSACMAWNHRALTFISFGVTSASDFGAATLQVVIQTIYG